MSGNRRQFVSGMAAALSALGAAPALATAAKPFAPFLGARSRVLFVNDLSGDIDGLYAAVHGKYQLRTEGRKIRVYREVDTRMMFGDFFAKLRVHGGA